MKYKKEIKLLITIALLIFLLVYLRQHWGQIGELLKFKVNDILLWISLCGLQCLVNSLLIRSLIKALGTKTGIWEMFVLENATMILNYAPMKFGTIFRANYLKKHYGLAYSFFGSYYVYLTLLTVFIASAMALISQCCFYGFNVYHSRILVIVYILLMCITLAFMFVPVSVPRRNNRLFRMLASFVDGRQLISKNYKAIFAASLLLVLNLVNVSLRLFLIFRAMGKDVSFAGCIILGSMGFISLLVGLTPGALGIRELMIGGSAALLGFPIEIGLLAAVVDRAVLLAYTFSVGTVCAARMWFKSPQDFHREEEGNYCEFT